MSRAVALVGGRQTRPAPGVHTDTVLTLPTLTPAPPPSPPRPRTQTSARLFLPLVMLLLLLLLHPRLLLGPAGAHARLTTRGVLLLLLLRGTSSVVLGVVHTASSPTTLGVLGDTQTGGAAGPRVGTDVGHDPEEMFRFIHQPLSLIPHLLHSVGGGGGGGGRGGLLTRPSMVVWAARSHAGTRLTTHSDQPSTLEHWEAKAANQDS